MARRPVLEFWFDFASTYAYLSAMRIEPLAETAGVDVRYRPFLLGPIFQAQGWTTSPFNLFPSKGRYMWRDVGPRGRSAGACPSASPIRFRRTGSPPPRVALFGADKEWCGPPPPPSCARSSTPSSARGRSIEEPSAVAALRDLGRPRQRRRYAGRHRRRQQAAAARGQRGGAHQGRLRRADLLRRGRRDVLGRRSPGAAPWPWAAGEER